MNYGPESGDEQVYGHPDDPYVVTTRWDADGFHIVVSADVLAGGDAADVQAEAQRRADVLRDHLLDFVRPVRSHG